MNTAFGGAPALLRAVCVGAKGGVVVDYAAMYKSEPVQLGGGMGGG